MNPQEQDTRSLPPLPDRALTGLKTPWQSPTGESFHTVKLWEFTNLYVIPNQRLWKQLSQALTFHPNLAAFARQYQISRPVLSNIRDNPSQSISVPNLKKLSRAFSLDQNKVEQQIKAVRFNMSGEPEKLTFPFQLDVYSWRVLCHIAGDGNVHQRDDRPYPYLRWTQEVKHQQPMRELLTRLSRAPGGKTMNVNYPKALSYAIMGTMPGLTMQDLRTPKFIQFVIDLPMEYRDWKVEFLAAFLIDDGSVSGDISFHQKSRSKLEHVMALCDQLGYDHSPYPPKIQIRDSMHDFNLRLRGIHTFYKDLIDIRSRYPEGDLLDLWHKQPSIQQIVENISDKRLDDNDRAVKVCETILKILDDGQIRSSNDLRQHPKLKFLVKDYSPKIFRDRIRNLKKARVIREVKHADGRPYRPKKWTISPESDLETLLNNFNSFFGNRSHKQSYTRKSISIDKAREVRAKLIAHGIKPTPAAAARELKCSRQQIYRRKDLRLLFDGNDTKNG